MLAACVGLAQAAAASDAGAAGEALDAGPGTTAAQTLEAPAGAWKRVDVRAGEPTVPVRLMEGQQEVAFVPRGRVRLLLPGAVEAVAEAPAGELLHVRLSHGTAAKRVFRLLLSELAFADKAGLETELAVWARRGVRVRVQTLGQVYGIAGKVIDNRRYAVLTDEGLSEPEANSRLGDFLRRYGVRPSLSEEVVVPAHATLEVRQASGALLGRGLDRIHAETLDHSGFDVRQVEHDVGWCLPWMRAGRWRW